MKFRFFILVLIVIIGLTIGYFSYQNYEGDFFEVCFVYYKTNGTYVVVGDSSIKVSDENIHLYAKHIINDPFNYRIQSPTNYKIPNSYMYETLVSLYDDEHNIYIINVSSKEVYLLEGVETFQINEKKDSVMLLKNNELLEMKDTGFKTEIKIADHIKSFIATEDFKTIFVVDEKNELKRLNSEGKTLEHIEIGLLNDSLLKIDDFLLFNTEKKGYIYDIKDERVIGVFENRLSFENAQYIDNTLLIRSGSELYQVEGNRIDLIRGEYLLTEDISNYYKATNQTVHQMRGEVQVLLLDLNDKIYTYTPRKGRKTFEIKNNQKYIGMFKESLTYVFTSEDSKGITYYNAENAWSGKKIRLEIEPLWVKGHNEENFIYVTDQKPLMQMFIKDVIIPLNIISEHFQELLCGGDEDYYVIDKYGLVYVNQKGKAERIFEDENIQNSLFDPESEMFYFIDSYKALYEVDHNKVTQLDQNVKEIALFREAMYYINEDNNLYAYKNHQFRKIDEGVLEVQSVSVNERVFGLYNTVHMFYILEEK
ncbi:MAG: hypothetical protein JXR88_13465 [Clostridia bacterium]|nr:hypothetical protein [Clostridia bacterium]